jgi:hypothetical protein
MQVAAAARQRLKAQVLAQVDLAAVAQAVLAEMELLEP